MPRDPTIVPIGTCSECPCYHTNSVRSCALDRTLDFTDFRGCIHIHCPLKGKPTILHHAGHLVAYDVDWHIRF